MCSIAAPTSQSYGRRFWPQQSSALFTSRSLCAASEALFSGAERKGESAHATQLRSDRIGSQSDGMTSQKPVNGTLPGIFTEFSEAVSGYRTAVGARPKCGNGQVFKAGQKFRPGRCAGHFQPCAVRAASTLQV